MDFLEVSPAAGAGWIVFAALLALYGASLAPAVTFWDAGEFIAAIRSWGIPHPPGTPLYVTLGRAADVVTGGLPLAVVVNVLSAVCTAAACALGGALIVRRGAPVAAGIGAGLCAGCMTSVWSSATEAEVYSASLLLSALMLTAAQRAAVAGRKGDAMAAAKGRALLVYLFALAAPLHASALVAGPAAVWLAIEGGAEAREGRAARWPDALVLGGSLIAAGALATGRFTLAAIGAAALLALALARVRGARRATIALALGATPLLIMIVRARHDPAINQGDPSGWQALGDVIARRQYAVAALFPRQAPAWIQLANFFQYADWQVALGIAPQSTASVARLTVSLLFVALGIAGAGAHRARDAKGFRAVAVLLASGSLGVIAYLNLKAGPSIGWGILPGSAPHEARERDYFFALAFWAWGLWAGYGAVALAARRASPSRVRLGIAAGLMIASAPALLNWPVMNRRREPDAAAAGLLADALLESTPPNGVLLVWGDNDSYPLWEAQQARRIRRDVTVITSPLLGASWYRDELRRRAAIDPGALAAERTMVARTVASARAAGRPIAVAATVPADVRDGLEGRWTRCGGAWIDGMTRCPSNGSASMRRLLRARPAGRFTDNTTRTMLEALQCAATDPRAGGDSAAADSLARGCNVR